MPDGLCARCDTFPPTGPKLLVRMDSEEDYVEFCGFICKRAFVQGMAAMKDAAMSLPNVKKL